MRPRWPILALLCVLASLLVPGIASAHPVSGAENRVWAFDLAEQAHVAGQHALTPDQHQGCELAEYDSASGSLLAAKGGAKTPLTSGTARAGKTGTPNSIHEQLDGAGSLKSRTFYDENGRPFSRQDFSHPHGGMQPHEHHMDFDAQGRPNAPKRVTPLDPTGYDKPTGGN